MTIQLEQLQRSDQLVSLIRLLDDKRLRQSTAWTTLYALTLALQLPCVIARGMLFQLTAVAIAFISGWDRGLLIAVGDLLTVFPIAASLIAIVWPNGAGWWAALRMGARTPSRREQRAYDDAITALTRTGVPFRTPARVYILDDNTLNASVLGDTLLLNRSLIDSEHLAAVIAHELGHLSRPDANMTVAINRLAFLPAILHRVPLLGMLFSGELGLRIVWIPWCAWFRQREFEADQFAARLGEADSLAQFLETEALFFDRPVPFAFMSKNNHPPTEHRLDRLTNPAQQRA